jgi:methyltransferase (TIGR00027 family)
MRSDHPSQTALNVAMTLITLGQKGGWAARLPQGLVDATERIILASGLPSYDNEAITKSRSPGTLVRYEEDSGPMSGQFEAIGHRKCFINHQVLEAITVGIRQVMVIGAGFDTLCFRLAPQFTGVQFLELDHPSTSRIKHKAVARLGQPGNLHFISADIATSNLSEVLQRETRWSVDSKGMFIAEGLLMYMEAENVETLFLEAAACSAPGTRIAFTHMIPGECSGDEGNVTRFLAQLVGEPLLSSIDTSDLPTFLTKTGWRMISDRDEDPSHGIERYAVAELV